MSSACIAAFLLARRVTGSRSWALALAVLSVCMPWMLYAAMLMTEVAAYPAFLWALLALQRAVATPSRLNDLIAVAGLAFAYFARTALVVLVLVLPLAIVATARPPSRRGFRHTLASHRVLGVVYLCLLVGAVTLWVAH